MGVMARESNDPTWRSGLRPWFHGWGKSLQGSASDAGQTPTTRSQAMGLRRSGGLDLAWETS